MNKRLTLIHLRRRDFLMAGSALAALPLLASLPVVAQTPADTKIGVIGSGRLGGAVGTIFAKAGYKVMFSSRHPEELKNLVAEAGPNASAGSVQDAIAFGNVILLAVPYKALPDVGREHGAALKGKIVLDAGNPIPTRDGEIGNEGQKNGPGETTLKYIPGVRLVRAFNSFGGRIFATEGNRAGEKIGVPLASDDAEALKIAEKLVRDVGFEPVSVPLARGREFAPPAPLFTRALPVSQLKKELGIQ
ncbi:MAG TPA: NADPH-dependent F420 reductase [Xanthobacteraceae bacterium]|jgi:predicted dinucleotide-binding enzyme|nr:NADPH-dependent F420 reductase [Xanthobacteraceae bacterium]